MAFPCVYVANEAANRGIFLHADGKEGYSGISLGVRSLEECLLFRRAEMAPSFDGMGGSSALLRGGGWV